VNSFYPEKIVLKNSISRETALHLYHHPELYVAQKDNRQAIKRKNGELGAWEGVFNHPDRCRKQLLAYGLGCGLDDKEGEWMSAYGRNHDIPIANLFSRKSKVSHDVRVEVDARSEKRQARETMTLAELSWKNRINESRGHGRDSTLSHLHEAYQTAKRKYERFSDDDTKYKRVTFDDYMKNHDKYSKPLEVDEEYFKRAWAVHQGELNKLNFTHNVKNTFGENGFGKPVAAHQLREMASLMNEKDVAKYENKNVDLGGTLFKFSEPYAFRGNNKRPYLAYGMVDKIGKQLSEQCLVQDMNTGGVVFEKIEKMRNAKALTVEDTYAQAQSNLVIVRPEKTVVKSVEQPSLTSKRKV
jgi:hypothetical protein